MRWLLLVCLGIGVLLQAQDNDAALVDPILDARTQFQAQRFEFVSLLLAEGTDLQGLNRHQQERVTEHYSIRPLNRRWQTYANIDDDPRRLLHYQRYANRYNRMMWQLLMQYEQDQIRRQQY